MPNIIRHWTGDEESCSLNQAGAKISYCDRKNPEANGSGDSQSACALESLGIV
jgi:hypothetical protein